MKQYNELPKATKATHTSNVIMLSVAKEDLIKVESPQRLTDAQTTDYALMGWTVEVSDKALKLNPEYYLLTFKRQSNDKKRTY